MSKTTLLVVICAAVLAVGAIGAVTATVIVRNEGGGARMVHLSPASAPSGQALPPLGRRGGRGGPGSGPLGGLRDCLKQHGLAGPGKRGALPDLKSMRDALEACRGALPRP